MERVGDAQTTRQLGARGAGPAHPHVGATGGRGTQLGGDRVVAVGVGDEPGQLRDLLVVAPPCRRRASVEQRLGDGAVARGRRRDAEVDPSRVEQLEHREVRDHGGRAAEVEEHAGRPDADAPARSGAGRRRGEHGRRRRLPRRVVLGDPVPVVAEPIELGHQDGDIARPADVHHREPHDAVARTHGADHDVPIAAAVAAGRTPSPRIVVGLVTRPPAGSAPHRVG